MVILKRPCPTSSF